MTSQLLASPATVSDPRCVFLLPQRNQAVFLTANCHCKYHWIVLRRGWPQLFPPAAATAVGRVSPPAANSIRSDNSHAVTQAHIPEKCSTNDTDLNHFCTLLLTPRNFCGEKKGQGKTRSETEKRSRVDSCMLPCFSSAVRASLSETAVSTTCCCAALAL